MFEIIYQKSRGPPAPLMDVLHGLAPQNQYYIDISCSCRSSHLFFLGKKLLDAVKIFQMRCITIVEIQDSNCAARGPMASLFPSPKSVFRQYFQFFQVFTFFGGKGGVEASTCCENVSNGVSKVTY